MAKTKNAFTIHLNYSREKFCTLTRKWTSSPDISKSGVHTFEIQQFDTSLPHYKVVKGDEVIAHYRTGGAVYGWYLGTSVNGLNVCLLWNQYKDIFSISSMKEAPLKAHWTKFYLTDGIAKATEQMDLYRVNPGTNNVLLLDIIT